MEGSSGGQKGVEGALEGARELHDLREVGVYQTVLDVGDVASAGPDHVRQLLFRQMLALAQDAHVLAERARKMLDKGILCLLYTSGMLLFLGFFLIMANQDIQRFVFGNW